jgi:hypothetical protein
MIWTTQGANSSRAPYWASKHMFSLAFALPSAWQIPGPRRAAAAHATHRRVLPIRASATEADAALWTLGLAAAAYFSSYASEGYEPHRL